MVESRKVAIAVQGFTVFLLYHDPYWLSDSNRTILASKELHLIIQILVRRISNPIFDATLRKVRHGRLNVGSHTSEGHPYNQCFIKWLGTKLDEMVPPRNESQICLTTILARLLSESLVETGETALVACQNLENHPVYLQARGFVGE